MKFKVGDLVTFNSNKYCDGFYNPLWGGKFGRKVGKVVKILCGGAVRVEWSSRKGVGIYYMEEDLEFHCPKKSKENCYKCKSRLQCITRGVI